MSPLAWPNETRQSTVARLLLETFTLTPKRNMKTINRRQLLRVGTAALSLAAIPKMVHSQVLAARHAAHPHWDLVLNHAGKSDWLRRWVATMVREPERRIPGLLVVGPQVSGKTTLHQAFGSLLSTDDYRVSETYRGQSVSALVGKRILSVREYDDFARDPLFTDHGRHEEFIGRLLSMPDSRAHWVETCQHQYVEAGPWLKLT
jgi:hypothetical protein